MSESRKQAIELLKGIDICIHIHKPKDHVKNCICALCGPIARLKQAIALLESEQEPSDKNERVLDFLSFPVYLMLNPFCQAVGGFKKKVIVSCADKKAMDRMEELLKSSYSSQKESERLKGFARRVIKDVCWNMSEPDGGDMQDIAEKLGLIKSVIAKSDDIDEDSDFEVGDIIFKFTDILKGE